MVHGSSTWLHMCQRICIYTYNYMVHGSSTWLDKCNKTNVFIHIDGVATMSRLLKIIGLVCKRDLQKRLYSAKEMYNLKEPNNRSHHIPRWDMAHPHDKTNVFIYIIHLFCCICLFSRIYNIYKYIGFVAFD